MVIRDVFLCGSVCVWEEEEREGAKKIRGHNLSRAQGRSLFHSPLLSRL